MTIATYVTYLIISIGLTIWVAQTLFKNGRIFLVDVFAGNEELADSVNHLLVVGFYLLNLGFVSLALKIEGDIPTMRVGIEDLSQKLGIVLLVLGVVHFFNLVIFSKVRSTQLANRKFERMTPPQPPYAPMGQAPTTNR